MKRKKVRKDNKGRVLNKGEGYRGDIDSYIYQYRDRNRKNHVIYAGNLLELREKEQLLMKDILDGIDIDPSNNCSFNYYHDKYLDNHVGITERTKFGYQTVYDNYVRESFGNLRIKNIKYSDVKAFYSKIVKTTNVGLSTLKTIDKQVGPVFKMCIKDNLIRSNPAEGVLREIVKEQSWKTEKRISLTIQQEKEFLSFTEKHPVYYIWYPLFVFLLGTGLRIGEASGITWDDIDFDKKLIFVRRQLQYVKYNKEESTRYRIFEPKTINGIRVIPMMNEVYQQLLDLYLFQSENGFSPFEINGISGFVFYGKTGKPTNSSIVNKVITRIIMEYNEEERCKAGREKRPPEYLPRFSCHNFRHTFATRLCETTEDLKTIQEIMGHASIRTTMDVYADATIESKYEAITSLSEKNIL